MKTIKYSILIFLMIFSWIACDVDYEDNPNEPSVPPTSGLFNNATKVIIDASRDEWFEGRFTLPTMQYWAQVNYTEEDRYQYRPGLPDTWSTFYRALENYRLIIQYNTDEATKNDVLAYGPNEGQIAVARIMLAYTFNLMADTFGDIPYYSYGTENPDFQALNVNEVLAPKYAQQKDIYLDILNELKAAAAQLGSVSGQHLNGGDAIYFGDLSKWQKFANSLRMRIAVKLLGTSEAATAMQHINEAKTNAFTSNADNAALSYEANDTNASPFYKAYYVDNRTDFAVAYPFVRLLKGEDLTTTNPKANPFSGLTDPRLPVYVAPNGLGNHVGMPYGVESAIAPTFKWWSLPGTAILDASFNVPLMDYAEVEFILSELNGWDQTHYENGVKASIEKWNPDADATAYVATLPPASEETVLTQKYIALYMQSHAAWTEYRRTGYPQFLIMPGESYTVDVQTEDGMKTFDYEFIPLVDTDDIPTRVTYPGEEANINGENLKEATSRINGGDEITSKLWWDVN
ncbi:SusD/RagB-like outer membrane lipoprotein [Balneicella halophila]|uniref:SusD/RagB-like outer membrane lipoprotein n=1 Tax=Balneicella halophila TaxID=1537566 RepID=A0A7L4URZ2_BALHA|nr:SusD/RagB family nutrient-binding outer membrane lipoprotein [Balneicella halophila]PVX52555.1 SusD/RagB-like outer membrane lipoprotein [Balneicella halophila]